jgi:hypothetical protein
MIDVAAVRSLADLYRREQSVGHCLDPDEAATTAVTHLVALGYRGPQPRPDLVAPARTVALPPADSTPPPVPVIASSMERAEVDARRERMTAGLRLSTAPASASPASARQEHAVPAQRG